VIGVQEERIPQLARVVVAEAEVLAPSFVVGDADDDGVAGPWIGRGSSVTRPEGERGRENGRAIIPLGEPAVKREVRCSFPTFSRRCGPDQRTWPSQWPSEERD
jgi:hypothetical protein